MVKFGWGKPNEQTLISQTYIIFPFKLNIYFNLNQSILTYQTLKVFIKFTSYI